MGINNSNQTKPCLKNMHILNSYNQDLQVSKNKMEPGIESKVNHFKRCQYRQSTQSHTRIPQCGSGLIIVWSRCHIGNTGINHCTRVWCTNYDHYDADNAVLQHRKHSGIKPSTKFTATQPPQDHSGIRRMRRTNMPVSTNPIHYTEQPAPTQTNGKISNFRIYEHTDNPTNQLAIRFSKQKHNYL